ncbi:MAG: 23S rRNA (guanosine(2251)-2'-O)-methyltransferase RlmB [Pseudomonadota bacterium]
MAQRRRSTPAEPSPDAPYWLYGLHAVRAALANPHRTTRKLVASKNALQKLDAGALTLPVEEMDVRSISRLLGDAVHQGVAVLVDPLPAKPLEALQSAKLVLCLDHITDPHNVGAILRSAVAFKADAVITTTRHAASESGVLAKSASGALDLIDLVTVTNLSRAIEALKEMGFEVAALDSEADQPLEALYPAPRWAFVLGAEGKGVRQGVRAACGQIARIEAGGALTSLNVSNAAAIILYAAQRGLLDE